MMIKNYKVLSQILLILLMLKSYAIKAQSKNFYPWIMPAVSYQLNEKTSLFTQLGYTPTQNSVYIYVLGFYKLNKNITLQVGYFGLSSETERKVYRENDFVLAGMYSKNLSKFTLEDRNMFLGIFPSQGQNQLYYRNRLRILSPTISESMKMRFYVFGEGYYSFKDHNFTRNRKGGGVVLDASKNIQFDVSYLHQEDRYLDNRSLIFFQITAKLN